MSLFRTTIKGMKNKSTKKEVFKRKRVNKPVVKTIVSYESSVDREPLIKRMRKPLPTTETQKVDETTTEIHSVRIVEDETEVIIAQVPDQVASPSAPIEVSSKPTVQIRGVMDDLPRQEDEEEVSTPLRASVQIDEE